MGGYTPTIPTMPLLALDADALASLIDAARAVFLDEVARCRAAYAADAGETASARAGAARRACPEDPWRWYLDPDMADLEAALERLPQAEAVRKVLGGPHDR